MFWCLHWPWRSRTMSAFLSREDVCCFGMWLIMQVSGSLCLVEPAGAEFQRSPSLWQRHYQRSCALSAHLFSYFVVLIQSCFFLPQPFCSQQYLSMFRNTPLWPCWSFITNEIWQKDRLLDLQCQSIVCHLRSVWQGAYPQWTSCISSLHLYAVCCVARQLQVTLAADKIEALPCRELPPATASLLH